ncbi:MAG: SDR family NAD(P)-dependent oxidoreductase [Patulibacter sp.]|nr:SDR family NAD(P)-dependent oxidoreductase [Patulibacter sp.]
MSSRRSLEGRVALVTGAGRGLGRAYARALAARGALVAVNNRSGEPAERVVAEILASGGQAIACVGDLEAPGAAERAVAATVEAYGRIDVLVNNAGGIEGPADGFAGTDASARDAVLRQNFATAWDVTAAAWPHLTAAGYGRVVLCASPIALSGSPGFAHYAAAKAALIGLGRTLAVEGADHGVTVNVLSPVANTQEAEPTDDFRRWYAETFRTDHVAEALAWLVDERCTVTGEILAVGGPRIARIATVEGEGYVDGGSGFSAESVGAHFDAVLDQAPTLRFPALTDVMAHWQTTHGSPTPKQVAS